MKAFVARRVRCKMSWHLVRRRGMERLETLLVPKFWQFCSKLPKTKNGKITR